MNQVPFAMLDQYPLAGRRRTINGAMEIDQANEGASVTANSTSQFYVVDMLDCSATGAAGVFTGQQLSATPPPGFKNYVRFTTSTADASPAAGSTYYSRHHIEGNNVVDFNLGTGSAVPFTMSFWARSSLSGTFSGAFLNSANNRSYPFTFPINNPNTWEYKTVTVAQGDITGTWLVTNGRGLSIAFDLGCGSNFRGTAGAWVAAGNFGVTGAARLISTLSATFDITGLQLEPGLYATPYERKNIGEELRGCQRYYAKTFSQGTKPGNAVATSGSIVCGEVSLSGATTYEPFGNWDFPAEMRTAPTITLYTPGSGTTGQWGNPNANTANARTGGFGASTRHAQIDNAGTGITGGQQAYIHATADARL